MKIKICGDVFNISKRIKDIDCGYYIVFNTFKQSYEIHNSKQIGSTFCLTLPFNELDERCLEYILKTQSSNIDEIIEKLEIENNLKESANRTSAFSEIYETLLDLEK